MPSKRTVEQRKRQASKKASKHTNQKNPGGASVYALKRRGTYPPNSPYRTLWSAHA